MGEKVLRVGLLGSFSVAINGEVVPEGVWRLRKAKTLVKLLALAPGRRLHSDEIGELLWPERDPAAMRNNLHQAIYAARRALGTVGLEGGRCLELREDVLALCPEDPPWIDVVAFEAAAARARETRDPAAYREALELWRGELLPEDRYEDWSRTRREALNELRVALAIELAEMEAASDPGSAIDLLRETTVEEPLHEPARRALMRLYAEAGRRHEALAQFQELKRALRREFEDDPDQETRRLYQEILTRGDRPAGDGQVPSSATTGAALDGGRLPGQLSSFVGRERELGELSAMLGSSRLLTLTGAGGCGKTRLGIELARRHADDFPAGVWSVELAALMEPSLIGPAIAQAMDVRLASDRAPEVALARHIGERTQLLLLDNCEHLVEPVAHLVEALLQRCPNLSVLATSREPLRVPGEVTWRVPSLSLPDLRGSLAADRVDAESVGLFAERARQARPDFALDDENAPAVAALCHRLDGMPLAIELAAARVGAMTPAQIVDRLDHSLDLLSTGERTAMTRQQTLRATLAWSFDLLEAEELVLLRRLAVFAGGFGLEAAEDVCGEPPLRRGEAVDLLGRLADKSLVQVESARGSSRYRLLETVRQYSRERLEEVGEAEAFERRHREWYLDLAESDPTPEGDLPAGDRLHLLDLERDNLRAALASAMEADPQVGLRLSVALWRFWLMRGYLAEGYGWLDDGLSAAPGRTAARARALRAACLIGLRRGVHDRLHEFGAESVAIFEELGSPTGMLDAAEVATAYRLIVSPPAEIEELLERFEGLRSDEVPEARPRAWAAHSRGIGDWLRRRYGPARVQLEAALEGTRAMAGDPRPALWPLSYGLISVEPEVGYPLLLHEDTVLVGRRVAGEAAAAYVLVNLAAVDRAEGRFGAAAELIEESLLRFRHLGDAHGEAYALNATGNLARSSGDYEGGRAALEASLRLREEIADRRGTGITLGCLALLDARAGDLAAGRSAAERARGWFLENDDLVGLSAAELTAATLDLGEGDRKAGIAHLEEAAAVLGRMESTHQEGWALAVLGALASDDGEELEARRWLDHAVRHFRAIGSDAGLEYCRVLGA
ncbi:MAG: BTAD domain-containing putative transcriptional regulator [Syntrophothermus sp.]